MIESAPKTDRSVRAIPIAADAVALLRRWRATQLAWRLQLAGAIWDAGWVFTTELGEAIPPDTIGHAFAALRDRLNLQVRFHDLRHVHATLLISQGVAPTVASARLGHSRTSTTMDIYAHALATASGRRRGRRGGLPEGPISK